MKNIYLFLITILGLFAVSCNPMADINEELDVMAEEEFVTDTFIFNRAIAPDSYTLTDEDYELSSNEDVAKYKNFSEYVLPKDFLPEILNKKFTAPDAFLMQVTYDFYSKTVVDSAEAYQMDSTEYAEFGQGSRFYFKYEDEAEYQIAKLLNQKAFETEVGTEKTVLYNQRYTNEDRYVQVNPDLTTEVLEEATEDYELVDDDYENLGENYNSFYYIETAQEQLVEFYQTEGETEAVIYKCAVYANIYDNYYVYRFDGMEWSPRQSVMAVSEPLNFSLDGDDITKSYWWADPAIKLTLGADDYALFTETATYNNFDLRSGSTPGTDSAKLVEMVGAMLDANHDVVEDQQYLVSYVYYDGGSGVGTIRVIKTGGTWSEVE